MIMHNYIVTISQIVPFFPQLFIVFLLPAYTPTQPRMQCKCFPAFRRGVAMHETNLIRWGHRARRGQRAGE